MNHAEFHQAVVALAEGRYCSTQVQATTSSDGHVTVTWSAYGEAPVPTEAVAEI